MRFKILFYLITIHIFGCYNQIDYIANDMETDTVIDFNQNFHNSNARHYIYDIVDSVQIIALETNEASVLYDFSNFELGKDYIYILDQYKNGSVAIFRRDGSFVKRITNGPGPEEINRATDITFDQKNGELIVFQIDGIKKYSSDGVFKEKYEINYIIHDFIPLNNGNGYIVVQDEGANLWRLFSIFWVDSNFTIQRIVNLPLRTYLWGTFNPHILSYDKNGNINLARAYDDNVYIINDTTIHIKNHIDFSDHELVIPEVSDVFDNTGIQTLMRSGKYVYKGKFSESDNYEFYLFQSNSNPFYVFYRNKNNGSIIGPIGGNYSLLEAPTYYAHSDGDFFVAVKEHTEDFMHYEKNSEVFSPEQMKILATHTTDDNPLIILYKLKDVPSESE